ncbi:hypothetical protein [Spongiibacter sp. UBA1325]|uniref:hypothetical protein n=1 Tax=Spongiibacter sp. UBA1325 TaxID=1947543 RepID=UPI002580709A|nr:hypothetical protein [Spongiibacter sp. UBA1325]|tara:strand:- start:3993 stop:4448 length:456 start_codon:yes stop_codon:yes gene_type:complete
MDFEFILPLLGTLLSLVSLYLGTKNLSAEKQIKEIDDIRQKLADHESKIRKHMSEEEAAKFINKFDELKAKLYEIEKIENKENRRKESGKVEKAVITYIVPAMAALGLVGLYIYLWIIHGDDPNYSTPEALNSIMSVVVGYLFGATAASNT